MANSNFLEGVKLPIPQQILEVRDGLYYVSWVSALALAQRPAQTVVHFDNKPALPLFGGAVVAVDMALPSGKIQRTWMPVLDHKKQAVCAANVTARQVTDTLSRARAKAVAMVTGVGLSLYAGYQGNGPHFLQDLGLAPGGDPAGVQAITSKKTSKSGRYSVDYLDWASALAAARITDTDFHWEVVTHNLMDADGVISEKMALPFAKGFFVAVRVQWRHVTHVELLPIMSDRHEVLESPNAADWNRAVMRCLSKAIAVATGYGLSLYAGEDLTVFAEAPSDETGTFSQSGAAPATPAQAPARTVVAASTQAVKSSTPRTREATPPAAVSAAQMDSRVADLITQIENGLREMDKDASALISWLGYPAGTSFAAMPLVALERAARAVSKHKTA